MALPNSGNPIKMSQIKEEYNSTGKIGDYRGLSWYLANVQKGTFPLTNISFSTFFSKRKLSPVTAGNATISTTGNWTVPLYETLTITVYAGQGGQSGATYSGCAGTPGSGNGSAGGASSFGSYASATGGSGGSGNLVSGTQPSSGAVVFTNPVNGGTGPATGDSVYITCGGGGGGGGGGPIYALTGGGLCGFQCTFLGYAASGATGAGGSVVISWT